MKKVKSGQRDKTKVRKMFLDNIKDKYCGYSGYKDRKKCVLGIFRV